MKNFKARELPQEIAAICRLYRLREEDVVRQVVEWMDFQFHGVVPLPLEEASQPEGRGLEE